jgi:two-component system, OmpR family, heavy metal sensor histidine kinase CusS
VVGEAGDPAVEEALGEAGLEVVRCGDVDEAARVIGEDGGALVIAPAGELLRTREANRALRELAEKKRILASLVVHDLRNPLTALHGNIGLLDECLASTDETVLRVLRDLQDLTEHTLSLVASLLDVEDLEVGLLTAAAVEVDVAELLSQTSRHQRAVIEFRQLALEVDVAGGLCWHLDPHLIGRVIENLLDNGVRYAPRGGRVQVSAHADGEHLVIGVSNSGPPIPHAQREVIFERYFRVEERRESARANRGLGLYFCKLAAEAHGGTIAATDGTEELPGRFELRLPAGSG